MKQIDRLKSNEIKLTFKKNATFHDFFKKCNFHRNLVMTVQWSIQINNEPFDNKMYMQSCSQKPHKLILCSDLIFFFNKGNTYVNTQKNSVDSRIPRVGLNKSLNLDNLEW